MVNDNINMSYLRRIMIIDNLNKMQNDGYYLKIHIMNNNNV